MKKRTNLILIIIFIIGLSILLYPFLSQYWNSLVQTKTITNYDKIISKINSNNYNDIFQKAILYNQQLSNLEYPFIQYKNITGYSNLLNINNNGMMGYITIPKIDIELPIYHGTSSNILNNAIGHLQGSSLPIGGSSTHGVLSGHTGLPSSKLFTNLNKLEIGDNFTITILDRKLTYQVDQIKIVKPNDISNIQIIKNYDYVTLITCTPYGQNTHRLLVRGIRITDIKKENTIITSEAELIDNIAITIIISILLLIIITLLKIIITKLTNKTK